MVDGTQHDVVIVGAGIGGLVTGIRTLEQNSDLDVVIVEKGTRSGGTSRQSGGAFYCYRDLDHLHERNPPGDRELQELVVERHLEGWQWLEDHGVPLKHVDNAQNDYNNVLPECIELIQRKPVTRRVDPGDMIDALVESFESLGGVIQLETAMQELITDDSGRVIGVIAADADEQFHINANAVVLATGGYPANEKLVEEQFYRVNSDDIWLRASRWCTGDGILAAEAIGAKRSRGNNHFYGKSMIAPPAQFTPYDYTAATAYYGSFSIALNKHGERFADESASIHERIVTEAAARNGYGRIYYVFDNDLAESVVNPTKEMTIKDQLDTQRELGGRIAEVESMAALADTLNDWGVNAERAIDTITEYNNAIRVGRAQHLNPSRESVQLTVDSPPFYVAEVQPSITLTVGGLDVTTNLEVLSRPGSGSTFRHAGTNEDPQVTRTIDGLYAVGADVGNVGAITLAEEMSPMTANTVFGLIVGEEIAETVAPSATIT